MIVSKATTHYACSHAILIWSSVTDRGFEEPSDRFHLIVPSNKTGSCETYAMLARRSSKDRLRWSTPQKVIVPLLGS